MKKDTDDDRTTSSDEGCIGNARGLARSSLLLALISKRGSVFKLKAKATPLHLNNIYLSDIEESHYSLVGGLN